MILRSSLHCLLFSILIYGSGCYVPAIIAARVLPPETIHAKYVGLQGQTVGVMVWTDRGPQIDYPNLGLDLANSLQKKLLASTGKDGPPELKESKFPVLPASIARYQQDHPGIGARNIAEVAPRLGVSRLIYIEVNEFGTRAAASVDLYKGSMETSIKVVEVIGNTAKIAYEESGIKATYPPKVPEDGTPDGDDLRFYSGTVDAMSTEILLKLISHPSEEI